MEEATPIYESELPTAKPKMAPWLIVVLVLLGICVALPLAAICVIFILALLGPSIGNVFSNIVLNI
ncbi:MAG: hypothetical protein ACE5OS_14420 [Anaerolineae bacterium]